MAPSLSNSTCRITGICPPAVPFAVEALLRRKPAPVWFVVTETLREAEQLAEDIELASTLSGHGAAPIVRVMPESPDASMEMREAFAASSDRLAALSQLRARRNFTGETWKDVLVIATTPLALFQSVPAIEAVREREIKLESGANHPFQELADALQALDYDHEPVCEQPKQYAVRGGIIDVWPVGADAPVRLDFFGDTIEEIHEFDPVTQRSTEKVGSVVVSTSPSLALPQAAAGIGDYLGPRTNWLFIDPPDLEAAYLADRDADDLPASLAAGVEKLAGNRSEAGDWTAGLFDIDIESELFPPGIASETWETDALANHRSHPDPHLLANDRLDAEQEARSRFLKQLADWSTDGWRVHFVLSREGAEQRAKEILAEDGIAKLAADWHRGTLDAGCRVAATTGVSWKGTPKGSPGIIIVTETELFGRARVGRASKRRRSQIQPSQVDHMLDFAELVEGDNVVHILHGIGIFRGLKRIDVGGEQREVLSVEFDNSVTLHVPLQEAHVLSRYVGLTKTKPTLGKIGTNRWEKTRQAAERATLDVAAQLLEVQAKRDTQPGFACPPDSNWQHEFEGAFPFTETPDQLKAIDATKKDLEITRPMDRLICGDVGFGKTEVAIRAAFKMVMSGKQVAVLVPTTVLAQQHLNTFEERMAGYPVVVEMLSRFRTKQEQKRILDDTANGRIDILIGTHRLIQSDVQFKDVGLVVIDEEQRFGVKHKEVFKQWRATIDVLSMSATPIPRTLYLALTGARDLSAIETPPMNRHPIQTIVRSYDEKIVIDAIRHEVRRGGQVFYLHNRVLTIDAVANHLRALLPDLSIGVGHGKMHEDDLERVMTDFVAGRYHVLVCTTIIESGLDIPNCNTIIIEGADRFGLSQLYQLRGRVGRFKHQAYAYLLLHRHGRLMDVARQRLNALRQHNQLGAGFRIAMRDLELRGAGNLLGAEQSGHVAGVGFELYCQLLRQSVARLKGEKVAARVRASVKLDFVFVGEGEAGADLVREGRKQTGYTVLRDEELAGGDCPPIQARIPPAYITEARLRIDFYRRLAMATTSAELKQIEADLTDRFGNFGNEVRALLLVTEIRLRAEQKGVVMVESDGNRLKCLKDSGRRDDYHMLSGRFPRLTAKKPLPRLREISSFLHNLPDS